MRNYGIMSGSASLRGASADEPATRDIYASHDSNSSDREFGAFCFALFGLTCPFVIAGIAVTGWLLFFQ